ncbi:Reverse transcriptase zinc-binding domain [Macleaya cordata]|uniref:Reverse transcriptase zinc-binding domain n=1 Tax=Macleaya cordata TaxID=56857 RepID=A0A200PRI1_MACCD|nr:Reverse transcriptase zinc-binding domain [Macleaya cordata]
MWRGISNVKKKYIEGIRYQACNGIKIKFWLDPWLKDKPLCDVFPGLFAVANTKDFFIADMFEIEESGRLSWNCQFNRRLYDYEIREVVRLLADLDVFCFEDGEDDGREWKWNKGKSFSVKSCYNNITHPQSSTPFPVDKIWSKEWSQRVSFFLWLVYKLRILTYDSLMKKGRYGPNVCYMCLKKEESVNHTLLHCDFAQNIWRMLLLEVVDKIKLMMAFWVEGREEFRGVSIEQMVVNWKEMFYDPP